MEEISLSGGIVLIACAHCTLLGNLSPRSHSLSKCAASHSLLSDYNMLGIAVMPILHPLSWLCLSWEPGLQCSCQLWMYWHSATNRPSVLDSGAGAGTNLRFFFVCWHPLRLCQQGVLEEDAMAGGEKMRLASSGLLPDPLSVNLEWASRLWIYWFRSW